MTDKAVVKEAKKLYGAKFFDQYSLNSIVLERDSPDNFHYFDIEKESFDMKAWINKMSLDRLGANPSA